MVLLVEAGPGSRPPSGAIQAPGWRVAAQGLVSPGGGAPRGRGSAGAGPAVSCDTVCDVIPHGAVDRVW